MTSDVNAAAAIADFQETFTAVRREIANVVVGHEREIETILTAFFAGGHVLIEGVPGIGKTLIVRSLAEALNLTFNRIQFTVDLMPADITGTRIVNEGADGRREFMFVPGPVFAHVLLADEINRATPKTQSALLEAMAEQQVTVAGTSYALAPPFFVLATLNPIEMEGTYQLPEAQLDRFLFKLSMGYMDRASELEVMFDNAVQLSIEDIEPVVETADVQKMIQYASTKPELVDGEVPAPLPKSERGWRATVGSAGYALAIALGVLLLPHIAGAFYLLIALRGVLVSGHEGRLSIRLNR